MPTDSAAPTPPSESPVAVPAYEAPQLLALGTLADLTRGGSVSAEHDMFGEAGASGTI